jgi:hypothetical protein
MAAFLTVDMLRAHVAPVCPRAVVGRPACRWQSTVSAPFFPPPD